MALVSSLLACESSPLTLEEANPTTLRDQSGAVFDWDCSGEERRSCKLSSIDGEPALPPCDDPQKAGFSYSWGRFVELHAICSTNFGWGSIGGWERLTVCEADDECPQMLGVDQPQDYECRAGFCQNVDLEQFPAEQLPDWSTMLLLCTGDMPRYQEFPADMVAAVNEACPDHGECFKFPEGCPDPR